MADVIIPFNQKKEPDYKCSFCGTPTSKVRRMFSNKVDKFICDVCVVKAKKLMDECVAETTE